MAGLALVEDFLSALASQQGFSKNTLSAYRNDLTQFSSFVPGDWPQVTRESIISFLLYLKERRYAPTTVARKQAAIKSFFKYLVSKGMLASNPSEELASQHVDRSLPHTIPSSDIALLLQRLNAGGEHREALRDRAMMQLLYATGLRVGEMVALNVGDIDLGAGIVTTLGRGKSRRVPINAPAAREALREYLKVGRPALAKDGGASLAQDEADAGALFLNHRGQRLTRQGFWLILKRYADEAGLREVTPHTLRHSFAAEKMQGGADVRDLQRILGHANVSTTQVYARLGQKKPLRRPERASRGGKQRKAVL